MNVPTVHWIHVSRDLCNGPRIIRGHLEMKNSLICFYIENNITSTVVKSEILW